MNIGKYFNPHVFCFLMLMTGNTAIGAETDIEKAITAVNNNDYEMAFKEFQVLANEGNPEAQHNLALLYRLGKGVKKDIGESFTWFRKAADQGVVDAQYYVGLIYDNGEGVEKNSNYAFIWYRKAAEQGHGLAQINLGVQYANGFGIDQDLEQAYLWFHVAATQGYKAAFENKEVIGMALGPEAVERLKEKSRMYFQQYVKPFQRHSSSYPRLR